MSTEELLQGLQESIEHEIKGCDTEMVLGVGVWLVSLTTWIGSRIQCSYKMVNAFLSIHSHFHLELVLEEMGLDNLD